MDVDFTVGWRYIVLMRRNESWRLLATVFVLSPILKIQMSSISLTGGNEVTEPSRSSDTVRSMGGWVDCYPRGTVDGWRNVEKIGGSILWRYMQRIPNGDVYCSPVIPEAHRHDDFLVKGDGDTLPDELKDIQPRIGGPFRSDS